MVSKRYSKLWKTHLSLAVVIEYRSASSAVPPMAWAVVGRMYPSRPVVRLDSSSLLPPSYVAKHPFGRASPWSLYQVPPISPSAPQAKPCGDHLHGSTAHASTSTHPLRRWSYLYAQCVHSCLVVDMQLVGLVSSRAPSDLDDLYPAASTKDWKN